jgi:hypothetical protein
MLYPDIWISGNYESDWDCYWDINGYHMKNHWINVVNKTP